MRAREKRDATTGDNVIADSNLVLKKIQALQYLVRLLGA